MNSEAFLRLFAKGGGHILLLAFPHRYAHFALLNRLIPYHIKVHLLNRLHPGHDCGFPAYYQCCTPGEIRAIMEPLGYQVTVQPFWAGAGYYKPFKPLHRLVRWFESVAERRWWLWAATHFVVLVERREA